MEETSFTYPHKPKFKHENENGKELEKYTKNAKYYFRQFCDNTSIHGIRFLGEQGRFVLEKVWWMLVISLALYGSANLIQKTYRKWITSPVIVTFATTETPIWEIPFPAVTICPELKTNNFFMNYTDVYLRQQANLNVTQQEKEYFRLFQLICDELPNEDNDYEYDYLNSNEIEDETISAEILQQFYDTLPLMQMKNCKWLGEDYGCEEIFTDYLTNEGFCLTFNMLEFDDVYTSAEERNDTVTSKNRKAQEWSLEYGYASTADVSTSYPRRTMLLGVKGGFQVDLVVKDEDLDYLCSELQGFKVTLHHPAEEPNMEKHFRIALNEAVVVGIKPKLITTAEEIKAYSLKDRQCYLPNEKFLNFFKIYSQQSCMFECLINYTRGRCGCYPFYASEGEDYICGPGSRQCVEEAKAFFLQEEVRDMINKTADVTGLCECLPACTSLEFDSETSQVDWNWRKSLKRDARELTAAEDLYHVSRLTVYYKENHFMTSERHELYGPVDFLANCGGLLGLFCGISFTSLMEIVYFLTLRLYCNLKKYGRRVWSGSPELLEIEDNRSMRNELPQL